MIGKYFTGAAMAGAAGAGVAAGVWGASADPAMSEYCSSEIAMIPRNVLDTINGMLWSLATHKFLRQRTCVDDRPSIDLTVA
jgi:hypothetical protein